MECRKCSYFEKIAKKMHAGTVMVGFCKLREKHISDTTVANQFCKDRAVHDVPEQKTEIVQSPEQSSTTF